MSEATARSDTQLSLLESLQRTLHERSADPSELLERAVTLVARACDAERLFVAVARPREPFASIVASFGLPIEQRRRASFRVGDGIVGSVIEQAQPLASDMVEGRSERFADVWPPSDGLARRYVCVPIRVRGSGTLGALCLDRRARTGGFLRDELDLLVVVAALLARTVLALCEQRDEQEEREREHARMSQLAASIRCHGIGCDSLSTRQVLALSQKLAPLGSTLLLSGESGVGKKLIARELHALTGRAERPLVSLNCETGECEKGECETVELVATPPVPPNAASAQAASGPLATAIARATTGTLLLHELPLLSSALQLELLHALPAIRSGASDVRLIATARGGLESAVRAGRFRSDLYYRLDLVPIRVPPLRERCGEIPALARHFLARFSTLHQRKVSELTPEAVEALCRYEWPGNVRELASCISRAVLLAEGMRVGCAQLPRALQAPPSPPRTAPGSLKQRVEDFERSVIARALSEAHGSQALAARALHTTPRVLGYRARKLGITVPAPATATSRTTARG